MRTALTLLATLLLFATGCTVQHTARIDKVVTSDVTGAHDVLIESRNGPIDLVVDSGRTNVRVEAALRAGGISLEEAQSRVAQIGVEIIEVAPGRLEIRARFPEPRHNGDGAGFKVSMPAARSADLRSSNGSLAASDVSGGVVLVTSNGNVVVRRAGGEVKATTSNGSIEVERAPSASVVTSNGTVVLEDVAGRASVSTSNGDVRVTEAGGPLDIGTSNGNVVISTRAEFGGTIDASTSNGKVVLVGGNQVLKSETDRRSGRLEFRTAGPASTVRTSNGTIEIKTQ